MFKYNRFNTEKLLESFKGADIKNGSIIIPSDYDIEINLIDVEEPKKSDLVTYSRVIREMLAHLPSFDNLVQKSCEAEYKKSNLHIRNFLFSLSYVDVSEGEIRLTYFGDEVNSEFTETFIKNDNDWVLQERIL